MKKPYIKTLKFNWPRKYYGRLNSQRLLQEFTRQKKEWQRLPRKDSFGGIEVANQLEAIEEILIRRNLSYKW